MPSRHRILRSISLLALVSGMTGAKAASVDLDFFDSPALQLEQEIPLLSQARSLATGGNPDEALLLIDAVIAEDGPSFAAYELKGVIEAVHGRLDAAVQSLTTAFELDPQSASTLQKLGDVYAAQDEAEKALETYLRAHDLDATDRKTNQRLGLVYEGRGDYAKAVMHLDAGRTGLPDSNLELALPLARAQLGLNNPSGARDVLLPAVLPDSKDAAAQRMLGVAAFGAEDWKLADERLTRARLLGDMDPQIAGMAAQARRKLGDSDGAAELLETLLETEGRRPALIRELATVTFESGNLERAQGLFRELSEGPEATIQDRLALGQIATIKQDFSAAVGHYNAVISTAPDQPDGYLRLANLAAGLRDYEGALRVLDGGLKRVPEQPELLRRKVLVLSRLGQNEAALTTAESVWRSDASRAADGVMLATLTKTTGNSEAAATIFEDVLSRFPESVGALAGLSLIAMENEETETAATLAARAYSLDSSDPMAAHAHGWSLSRSEATRDEGIALLGVAADALSDPVVLLRLAQAHKAAGDQHAARQAAETALSLSTEFPGADEARSLANPD